MAEMQRHIRLLTRQVATLEVNQDQVARKYNLIVAESNQIRGQRDEGRRDLAESTREMKTRILWLELWKRGAATFVDSLQNTLDNMVPRDGYQRALRELVIIRDR